MTTTTTFVWDPVSDCVISELDGTNAVQAVYTNEPQQYGGVLSQRRDTLTSTLHSDALGTTRLLTDSTQATTDTHLYDAWGNLVAGSGTTVNPFRWVGRYGYYHDTSTALVYVRARMYMPTVARWASVDPIGLTAGSNLFRYAVSAPVSADDPSGLLHATTPHGRSALWENCGFVCLAADWQLNPKETDGYIVQRVVVSFLGKDCDSDAIAYFSKCTSSGNLNFGSYPQDLDKVGELIYYEMWPVKNGKVYLSQEAEYPAGFFHDRLGICISDATSRTVDSFSIRTIAAFLPRNHPSDGWADPPYGWSKWKSGSVAWAQELYSVCEEVVPGMIYEFLGKQTISRSVGTDWDCCECECRGQATGNYGDNQDSSIALTGCKSDRNCSTGGPNDCARK